MSDLILRVSRGRVQGCCHVMGLAEGGERSLWLNLSILLDQDKQTAMHSLFNLSWAKGLFGQVVTAMQQASDMRKRQDEAFHL